MVDVSVRDRLTVDWKNPWDSRMGNHQLTGFLEWTPKMGLINGIPLGISPTKMGIAFGNRAVCYGEWPFFWPSRRFKYQCWKTMWCSIAILNSKRAESKVTSPFWIDTNLTYDLSSSWSLFFLQTKSRYFSLYLLPVSASSHFFQYQPRINCGTYNGCGSRLWTLGSSITILNC
jgi:hypothetical protein